MNKTVLYVAVAVAVVYIFFLRKSVSGGALPAGKTGAGATPGVPPANAPGLPGTVDDGSSTGGIIAGVSSGVGQLLSGIFGAIGGAAKSGNALGTSGGGNPSAGSNDNSGTDPSGFGSVDPFAGVSNSQLSQAQQNFFDEGNTGPVAPADIFGGTSQAAVDSAQQSFNDAGNYGPVSLDQAQQGFWDSGNVGPV